MTLARLLCDHPHITQLTFVSSSQAGKEIGAVLPHLSLPYGRLASPHFLSLEEARHADYDVIFSALPHLHSMSTYRPWIGKTCIIDLSADMRIPDETLFSRAYHVPIPDAAHAARAAYGISELYSTRIREANIIANPGCYALTVLMALVPLMRGRILTGPLNVCAISGISGAGRTPNQRMLFCERAENVAAYSAGTAHRHWAEIYYYARQAWENAAHPANDNSAAHDAPPFELRFIPHLAPMQKGIAVTIASHIRADLVGADADAAIELCFQKAYQNSPFARRSPRPYPETKDVRGSNRFDWNWRIEGNTIYLFAVIDNLIKGAAGQAIQNMNIHCGFPETAGLPLHAEL